MKSSGVYWKPVWNILDGEFTVVLANAQHIKNVPGCKTDQKDAEWIAQLLQHGLLRPSWCLRSNDLFCLRGFQLVEPQLQLRDFAIQLFRFASELYPPQPDEQQLQVLDLVVA